MIIGNGLIAKAFINSNLNHNDLIIFASGVSNSKENNVEQYNKEKELIIKTIRENKNLTFIYFSSILTGTLDNEYYKHKLEIENLISSKCNRYIIFRAPQIIGVNGNKNNLLNHFKTSINEGLDITIYKNTYRALIDVEDLILIVNYCLDKVKNEIVKISFIEKIDVEDLVNKISTIINKQPKIKIITYQLNNNWCDDNSEIVSEAISKLNIYTSDYTNKIIKKYIKN